MINPKPWPRSRFEHPTLQVARALLGQRLVRLHSHGQRLAGIITETEAYIGSDDLACHARSGQTMRNASMWGPAGHAYVFFTYGMHWMLNIVTEAEGFPAAVLLRGIWPTEGIQIMHANRDAPSRRALGDGPAKLCQALEIDRQWDGVDLCRKDAQLFIESMPAVDEILVTTGPRVGLTQVPEPWKSIPWRFRVDPRKIPAETGGFPG